MAITKFVTINGQLLSASAGGNTTSYIQDSLGSVVATVNYSGAKVNDYRYKPYGSLLSKVGAGLDPLFQYVGSYGYRATGRPFASYYVRARHYASNPGVWVSHASVEAVVAGEGAYIYAQSNPTSYSDPSGNQPNQSLDDDLRRRNLEFMECKNTAVILPKGFIWELTHAEPCIYSIQRNWMPTYAHWCNSPYAHCTACCTLAAKYGDLVAEYAQMTQNSETLEQAKKAVGKARLQLLNEINMRSKYCADGIEMADKVLATRQNVQRECSRECLAKHPFNLTTSNPRKGLLRGTNKHCWDLNPRLINPFPELPECD